MTPTDECSTCWHPRAEHYGGEQGSCMDAGQDGDDECTCKWFDGPDGAR